ALSRVACHGVGVAHASRLSKSARKPVARRLTRMQMSQKIGLLFAGQGAQVVGMGKDLADAFPGPAELFNSANSILGRKLTDIAWNGPLEELTKTSNCQPALFVHGLACLAVLRELA